MGETSREIVVFFRDDFMIRIEWLSFLSTVMFNFFDQLDTLLMS